MRASLATLAVVSVLGLATGCGGSADPGAGGDSGTTSAASHGGPQGACGGLAFAAHNVQRFAGALADADDSALQDLLGGRFEWFSVNDWPTSDDDAFVAYSPANSISFVTGDGGMEAELEELAVSSPREGGYVDVSYSGHVSEQPRAGGGTGGVLVGKGAVNCDGTIRVWSMAIKDAAGAFAACGSRPGRSIDGLVVCRMG